MIKETLTNIDKLQSIIGMAKETASILRLTSQVEQLEIEISRYNKQLLVYQSSKNTTMVEETMANIDGLQSIVDMARESPQFGILSHLEKIRLEVNIGKCKKQLAELEIDTQNNEKKIKEIMGAIDSQQSKVDRLKKWNLAHANTTKSKANDNDKSPASAHSSEHH